MSLIELPAKYAFPLVGTSSPLIRFKSEVFPDPEGPTKAVNSPSNIFKETLSTALTVLSKWPYSLQILSIKMPDSYVADFDKQFENEYSGLSGLERKEEIFVRAFGDQVMNISSIKNIADNTELDNILLSLIHQFLGIVTPKAGIAIDVFGKSLKQLLNENGTELLNPESLYDKSASITGLQISNLKEVLEIKCK